MRNGKWTLGALAIGLGLASAVANAQQGAAASPAQGGERRGQAHAGENFGDGNVPGPIDSLQDLQDTGKMLFKLADSDNNGLISRKEAVDVGNLIVGGFFFRADADGDGQITREEAEQARNALLQKRPLLRLVMQKVDQQNNQNTNNNNQNGNQGGPLNIGDAIRTIGNVLDANNDNILQASEVRQSVETTVQALFGAADTDRDGQLSPTEVNAAMVGVGKAAGQALFAAADKDGNGQLSQEEFLESLKEPATTVFAVLDANGDGQLSPQEMDRAQEIITSQLRSLQVPEPANSAANMIRTGRSPEQVAPVPDIRLPSPARDGSVRPTTGTQPATGTIPATRPGAAPVPGQPGATVPGQPGRLPVPGQPGTAPAPIPGQPAPAPVPR